MLTGLAPSEFWEMSMKEIDIYMKAYYKRQIDQMNNDMSLVWYNNAFARAKKLPELKKILIREKTQKTEKEMFETAQRMVAILGGEVR
jgi:hypothetical protein